MRWKLFKITLTSIALLIAITQSVHASEKRFNDPTVGGKLLDGCFKWPGNCNSQAQANAYCIRMGFVRAKGKRVVQKVGVFQTKRLGDGGVCTASCSVMTMVFCTTYSTAQ